MSNDITRTLYDLLNKYNSRYINRKKLGIPVWRVDWPGYTDRKENDRNRVLACRISILNKVINSGEAIIHHKDDPISCRISGSWERFTINRPKASFRDRLKKGHFSLSIGKWFLFLDLKSPHDNAYKIPNDVKWEDSRTDKWLWLGDWFIYSSPRPIEADVPNFITMDPKEALAFIRKNKLGYLIYAGHDGFWWTVAINLA